MDKGTDGRVRTQWTIGTHSTLGHPLTDHVQHLETARIHPHTHMRADARVHMLMKVDTDRPTESMLLPWNIHNHREIKGQGQTTARWKENRGKK